MMTVLTDIHMQRQDTPQRCEVLHCERSDTWQLCVTDSCDDRAESCLCTLHLSMELCELDWDHTIDVAMGFYD